MKDNQGRNLHAVKEHFDMLVRLRKEGKELSHVHFQDLVASFVVSPP